MIENAVINGNMKALRNTLVEVNCNLGNHGGRGKTYPVWVNGKSNNFPPLRKIDMSGAMIGFTRELLEEQKVVWTISELVEQRGDSGM